MNLGDVCTGDLPPISSVNAGSSPGEGFGFGAVCGSEGARALRSEGGSQPRPLPTRGAARELGAAALLPGDRISISAEPRVGKLGCRFAASVAAVARAGSPRAASGDFALPAGEPGASRS